MGVRDHGFDVLEQLFLFVGVEGKKGKRKAESVGCCLPQNVSITQHEVRVSNAVPHDRRLGRRRCYLWSCQLERIANKMIEVTYQSTHR